MKYELPKFLDGRVSHDSYRRWLHRKAQAHVIRDRKRNHAPTVAGYKAQIHEAVCASSGLDWYTGQRLEWEKISTWDNDLALAGRAEFKGGFVLLPTVDHVLGEDGAYTFVICAWRTNDAKSDMSVHDFIEFCRMVIRHHDRDADT